MSHQKCGQTSHGTKVITSGSTTQSTPVRLLSAVAPGPRGCITGFGGTRCRLVAAGVLARCQGGAAYGCVVIS